jgi:hypothetical protein
MTMNRTSDDMDKRVLRGLDWILDNAEALGLDLDRVDVDDLHMGSVMGCVLGQASATTADHLRYFEVVKAGAKAAGYETTTADWEVEHGFNLPAWDDDRSSVEERSAQWDALAHLWKSAILMYRDAQRSHNAQ